MAIVKLTRKRFLGPGNPAKAVITGRYRVWSKALGRYVVDQNQTTTSREGFRTVTWDNVHELYRNASRKYKGSNPRRFGGNSDQGGDFSSMSVYDWSSLKAVGNYRTEDGSAITTYSGGFYPTGWPVNYFTDSDFTNAGKSGKFTGEFGTATELGPKAWKKFKPKLYVADLGQFFGEIRETLPMLRTTAAVFGRRFLDAFGKSKSGTKVLSKELSNQWLNLQFGYKPFVSDLCKFFFTLEEFNSRLQQCIRDNGQWIRRRGVVESTMDNPTVPLSLTSTGVPGYPVYVTPTNMANGMLNDGPRYGKDIYAIANYTEKYHTWFSGCFRYYVPSFDGPPSAAKTVQNIARMYGIRISPILVWNLTPWSWLVDWVGNIGDNIDNYSAAQLDQLVAKYAYIMKTITGELQIQATIRCGGAQPQNVSWRRGFIVKTRRHANQFGFTIEPPNFSASQWSILASLGLSRLKIETKRG